MVCTAVYCLLLTACLMTASAAAAPADPDSSVTNCTCPYRSWTERLDDNFTITQHRCLSEGRPCGAGGWCRQLWQWVSGFPVSTGCVCVVDI